VPGERSGIDNERQSNGYLFAHHRPVKQEGWTRSIHPLCMHSEFVGEIKLACAMQIEPALHAFLADLPKTGCKRKDAKLVACDDTLSVINGRSIIMPAPKSPSLPIQKPTSLVVGQI